MIAFLTRNWRWLLPSLAIMGLGIAAFWGWSLADARHGLIMAQEKQIAAYAEGLRQLQENEKRTGEILLAREKADKKNADTISRLKGELKDAKDLDCGAGSARVLSSLRDYHDSGEAPLGCTPATDGTHVDDLPTGGKAAELLGLAYLLNIYQNAAMCVTKLTGLQEWVTINCSTE